MKKDFMSKILSVSLATLMLIPALISCGKPQDGNGTDAPGSSSSDTTPAVTRPTVDADGYLLDNIPEDLDFGGEKVTVLYWQDSFSDEFTAESGNTDITLDAIFRRNSVVEDRIGIKYDWVGIKGNNSNRNNYIDTAQNSIKTDTKAYDILAGYSMCIANLSSQGLLRDLNTVNYIDTSMPWWPERLVSEATIDGSLYFASGDISTNMLWSMLFLIYNKDLMKELNMTEDMNRLVEDKKWTLSKLEEMCRNVYADNDGVEGKSDGDRFGLMTSNVYSDAFFFGCGLHTVELNDKKQPMISESFGSEKTHDVIVRLLNLFDSPDAQLYTKNYGNTTQFTQNNSLFEVRQPLYIRKSIAPTQTSFGVLPMPLYNEDQQSYVTTIGFTYTLYAIPQDTDKVDAAAATIECQASEAYRKTTPAIFEVCLKVKYASDFESGRMFDIIRDGVTFDLGRMFCLDFSSGSTKYATYNLFRHSLVNKKPEWASTYAVEKPALESDLARILDAFAAAKKMIPPAGQSKG